jgi:hypothetical protein
MAGPNQRTGKVWILSDGLMFETMDGAKLTGYEGTERDAVTGTAVFGYIEKTTVPTVDCEIAHGPLVSLDLINAMTDVTITFVCDSGPIYALNHAWKSKPTEVTGGSGKMSVQFQGKTAIQIQ